MRQLKPKQTGFTLIELAVTITILGLLLASALPSFGGYLTNAKLREAANVVVANAMWSRNEAIKSNARTVLQLSGQSLDVSVLEDGLPVLLRSTQLPDTVRAPGFVASFDSAGRLSPFGAELRLILSPANQSCNADIRCPAIRFDAGGAVSICPTGVCS